ncbi:MAG: ribonuclease HII [Fastidiosipila sp.]|jgi:ribonuclease HII|nr:ribonuclease HII [Fastidiosipila sp.]
MTEKDENPVIRISRRDIERFEAMGLFEEELRAKGYRALAGVDEAGRGPLAGPVVAAACILPADVSFYGLNDSKKMSARRREVLYERIRKESPAWAIAMTGPEEIDRINILQATKAAMKRALDDLPRKPDMALVDAVALQGFDYPVLAEPKGDAKHNVIAAASVLAKVARDRMMENWDKVYPVYGFAAHKGYGTQAHRDAIRQYGPCPIHRRTFLSGIIGKPLPQTPYHIGLRVERQIAQELISRGHTILEHRYAVPGIGEIDFITHHRGKLYVIECKGRSIGSESFGGIEQSLQKRQMEQIRRTAARWIGGKTSFEDCPLTFLFAAARLGPRGEIDSIQFIPF